jgi:hypothetical protein
MRVLMTEGTSLSARQTLYALGRRHTIDVLDPSPLCQCRFSSLVRRWRKSPHYAKAPGEFLAFLHQQLDREEYDVLLPTHEQVYLLSRVRDEFSTKVGLALPSFRSMELMQNKANFTRVLRHLQIPVPATTIGKTREELTGDTFPLYLKLAHSTAGAGVFCVESPQRLQEKLIELGTQGLLFAGQEALLQQPARGVQATVQGVFDHGRLMGVHIFESRRLGVGGMSSARISTDHPPVRKHLQLLGEYLDWHGAMFLDYYYDQTTKTPEYIECNPRIGETVNACLSGTNLCELLLRISTKQPGEPLPLSRPGVRTHSAYMIFLAMALDGASRRKIWQELVDCRRRRGLYAESEDELTRPKEDPLSRLPWMWIVGQLLAAPGPRSRAIVRQTIANYSLPESAVEKIRALVRP